MAETSAIHPRQVVFVQQQQVIAARRAQLLMINSGTFLISAAWSIIIIIIDSSSDDAFPIAGGAPACALAAFFIFLVGVSLVMLALVADRFPRAARVGVAIATAFHRYFLSPGW
ncbi:hypothetical protein HU200_059186 [Digitaria exilis]|uniref:Uncharacterized protein n=1 Tax=Digitaria exilis TaxID=1010633 RepID=A0A835ALV4_9POAL|nr:hypothetical protein HU200_059186 [Digitaria exilis]CAB3468728.1 unnamed protein product [Digitaria exilis]